MQQVVELVVFGLEVDFVGDFNDLHEGLKYSFFEHVLDEAKLDVVPHLEVEGADEIEE